MSETTATKPRIRRVPHDRTGFLVLGTDDIQRARRELPPTTDHWGGSFPGMWVRRYRATKSGRALRWVAAAEGVHAGQWPKDAVPGVLFTAVRHTGQLFVPSTDQWWEPIPEEEAS